MPTPLIIKIDVTKLNKDWFFNGTKGKYADLIAYENDAVSQYGDSHTIKQNPSREAREQGAKPIIVGNGRWMPQKGGGQRPQQPRHQHGSVPAKEHPLMQDGPINQEEDDIPW